MKETLPVLPWRGRRLSGALPIVLLSLCLACSSDGAGGSADAAAAMDTEEESAARGGRSSLAIQHLLALADELFDFDPTLDPKGTAEANAAAIGAHVTAGLSGCGTVVVSGTTVTVTLPPPGCTFESGVTASGTVGLVVAREGVGVAVTVTLTNVVVKGSPLSGMVRFYTTTGSDFSVSGNLTSGTTAYQLTLTFSADPNNTSIRIEGLIAESVGMVATGFRFRAVVWQMGDCYPRAGTVEQTVTGRTTATITFDTKTATTGVVTVASGRRTTTATLPAYGGCPG